jgi:hypothetical protein
MVSKSVADISREMARAMVLEMPVPQLRRVMVTLASPLQQEGECGRVCGEMGCTDCGNVCGLGCLLSPGSFAVDSFDQAGRLGLTTQDFEAIRADLPALRREISEQLSAAVRDLG